MTIQLIAPNRDYEQSYLDYIAELGNEERYPFPLDWEFETFESIIERSRDFALGRNLPEGFVPSTTYWLVEGGEILGISNLRHFLNDQIRHIGGHIGLGIRPSRRGEGLGKILLQLTIEQGRERGIQECHIHCHKANQASAKMIQACGADLDSEIAEAGNAEIVQRYVLDTP